MRILLVLCLYYYSRLLEEGKSGEINSVHINKMTATGTKISGEINGVRINKVPATGINKVSQVYMPFQGYN